MSSLKVAGPNPGQEQTYSELSPIQKFFENANIFLTGSTGFLGIVLLEKLLFSCANISKIYILLRSKKGKNLQTRLDAIFDHAIFFRLKETYPNFKEKVIPVEGDCSLPEMGISEQNLKILKSEVNIIFHCAATVRFDENIKKAFYINVRAVRDIMKLAQQLKDLKSVVHVSTAFSNCIKKHIEEKVYLPAMEYTDLDNVIKLPDDVVTSLTPMLLSKYPNTYTFTKQIGEYIAKIEGKGLPVGIHRPPVVIPTYKEPVDGWSNSFHGPTGLSAGVGMGLIRVFNLKNVDSNMVPVDMVANSIIASAWDIAKNFIGKNYDSNDVLVYNVEASPGPRITWKKFIDDQKPLLYKYIPYGCLWYPFFFVIPNGIIYAIVAFLLHTVPAYVVDAVLFCLGKPPMLIPIHKKIYKHTNLLQFFTETCWTFQSDNTDVLKTRMSDEDKKIFFMDMKEFEWKTYLDSFSKGIRIYTMNDPLFSLPKAEKKLKRLYWINLVTIVLYGLLLLWLPWAVLQLIL